MAALSWQAAVGMTSAHLDQYRALAKYNSRFNRQIYDLVRGLSDEQRKRDMGAFFGSIDGTLQHILLADRIWLGRLRASGFDFPALEEAHLTFEVQSLRDAVATDFAGLERERIATDQLILAWVEDLTDEILVAPFRYKNFAGQDREHATWIAVTHLFNHQTHHRGQVTTLLRQQGVDPGTTDFLVFALA
jgi:uncharacterized damage-inducible protein DinB